MRLKILSLLLLSSQVTLFSDSTFVPISSHSRLFDDADLVAIVEFDDFRNFTIKEAVLPLDISKIRNLLESTSEGLSGYMSNDLYQGSEDLLTPVVFSKIPYLVFLKQSSELDGRSGKTVTVFKSVHGRHGCIPLIDLNRMLEFETIRDFYALMWHSYANGNAHFIYTPDYYIENFLFSFMKADYGTIDGTVIKEAILGIKDLLLAEDSATRMNIITRKELRANRVFQNYLLAVIDDVKVKESF